MVSVAVIPPLSSSTGFVKEASEYQPRNVYLLLFGVAVRVTFVPAVTLTLVAPSIPPVTLTVPIGALLSFSSSHVE